MISRDKIILMSRAAMLEQNNPKAMETNSYYRKEYVVSHFLVVWIFVSIVYAAFAAGIGVLFIEEFPKEAQNSDWVFICVTTFMIYILVSCVYVFICLIVYSVRYGKSQQIVKRYNNIMRQLDEIYVSEPEPVIPVNEAYSTASRIKKKKKKNSRRAKGGKA